MQIVLLPWSRGNKSVSKRDFELFETTHNKEFEIIKKRNLIWFSIQAVNPKSFKKLTVREIPTHIHTSSYHICQTPSKEWINKRSI